MAESGDWVTPRLWGEPWFEKPALLYWMTAVGFSMGLGPEWAPRLPLAMLSVAFLWAYGRILARHFDWETATNATLILATSVLWVAFSFVAVTDVPMAALLGMSILFQALERRPAWAGVFLGLAILAKGLVPLVLFLPWLLMGGGRVREVGRRTVAVAVAVAVAAPWYITCYLWNGDVFWREFIVKHHWQRFLSPDLQHVQPWWFYGPVLIGAFLFTWPLFGWVGRACREDRRLFGVAIWVAYGFVFFSAARNKLPGYLMPLVPGVALLLGRAAKDAPRWVFAVCAVPLVVIPPIASRLGELLEVGLGKVRFDAPPWWAFVAVVAVGVGVWRWRPLPTVALAVLGLILYVKSTALPQLETVRSARTRVSRGEVCSPLFERDLEYGMSYYAKRKVEPCPGD